MLKAAGEGEQQPGSSSAGAVLAAQQLPQAGSGDSKAAAAEGAGATGSSSSAEHGSGSGGQEEDGESAVPAEVGTKAQLAAAKGKVDKPAAASADKNTVAQPQQPRHGAQEGAAPVASEHKAAPGGKGASAAAAEPGAKQQQQEDPKAAGAEGARAAATPAAAAKLTGQEARQQEQGPKSPYHAALERCNDLACLRAAAKLERQPGQFLFPHALVIGWQVRDRGWACGMLCFSRAMAGTPLPPASPSSVRSRSRNPTLLPCNPAYRSLPPLGCSTSWPCTQACWPLRSR